jgi:hypothetical protein
VAHGGMVHFSYGAVLRLLGIAALHWRAIDGACAREGVDPLDLPLSRFLSLILSWTQEHTKPEDWDMVEAEIFAPLVFDRRDPDNVSQSVVENEMELFASFTRQKRALEGGA